jgi:hypothetical protein
MALEVVNINSYGTAKEVSPCAVDARYHPSIGKIELSLRKA